MDRFGIGISLFNGSGFMRATELENFTDAGMLFITQSTLSQQIKQLENE